jgi:serine/threonine protein kinase/membrane protein implicated in regulation of membrane protease activity
MGVIPPDTIIGNRYRVIQPLGEGGMKAVYLAQDLRFRARRCALAVMVDSFTSDEARRQAVLGFEREADILTQLDHPAIPKVSDRFSERDHHYFVMDYVAGHSLEVKLAAAGGRLPQNEAINIVLQVCEALHYLHSHIPPVIYRDLKPANIIVTPEGKVKLVDFGIARHFTRQGTTVGTVGYAAPEQYQGECEPRSDVYALGATLHHLLSGRDPARHPFDFPPLATLIPNCDPRLDELVAEALKRERTERLASADEFARRLQSTQQTPEEAENSDRPGGPGMRYCSRCGAAIPEDASRCPSCGRSLAPSSTNVAIAANPVSVSTTSTKLCPQCKRNIPPDAHLCPYCAHPLRAEATARPLFSQLVSNRVLVAALMSVVALIAGGLFVRGVWGSAAAIPWSIWLLAGLVLSAVEVHYTRDFTLFCFAISAMVVGLMTLFGIFNIWTQWISFAVFSAVFLFSAREWLRRKMLNRPGSVELENIIGQTATPLDDLPAYGFGKAELRGSTWSAHNASHMKILRGQRCKVMKMNGLTLWIMPE